VAKRWRFSLVTLGGLISLIGVLIFSLVGSLPVWSFSTPLGTIWAVGGAKITLDHGKSWLAPGGRSLPALPGTELRTTVGTATIELTDGSLIDVLPFSSLRFAEASGTTEMAVAYGRVTFQLPKDTRADFDTPSARLEPTGDEARTGEFFVGDAGLMGLKMSKGTFSVRPKDMATPSVVASREPVFLPKRPASGPLFTSDPQPPVPPNARAVFTPAGESIGYVEPDGRFVISPGFTQNLTRPFAPKLVRLGTASIPEEQRIKGDATPLFDVQGGYVGYLAGPVFYAQAQPAPNAQITAGSTSAMAAAGAGVVAAIGAGAGIGAGSGSGGGGEIGVLAPPPATPKCPPPGKGKGKDKGKGC
jgi:hypothetical protein